MIIVIFMMFNIIIIYDDVEIEYFYYVFIMLFILLKYC